MRSAAEGSIAGAGRRRVGVTGRPAWRRLSVIAVIACWVAAGAGARASDIKMSVTTIDGHAVMGTWQGYDEAKGYEISTDGGGVRVSPDELMSATFGSKSSPPKSTDAAKSPSMTFFLDDGGQLPGTLLGGDEEGIRATTSLARDLTIKFDTLAGIRLVSPAGFDKAEQLMAASLAKRLPSEDVLVTRDAEEPKVLRGRLDSIEVEQGSFTLGSRTRTFKTDRIYGIVLAAGVGTAKPLPITVGLRDGSEFTARFVSADASSIKMATSVAPSVTLSVAQLARLTGRSPRVVYVSDLKPAETHAEGRVNAPSECTHDVGLTGRPLVIQGVTFSKGIACPSRTELVYDLKERFSVFVAQIGIDDDVGPRGSVIFRVSGDDRELYASPLMTGRMPAELIRVDVSGVHRLTLTVDYGDDLDIADHADWGGARLIRPAAGS